MMSSETLPSSTTIPQQATTATSESNTAPTTATATSMNDNNSTTSTTSTTSGTETKRKPSPRRRSQDLLSRLSFESEPFSSGETGDDEELEAIQEHQRRQHQGVLWKRRDVFKNEWRPRWFILNPDQCLMTYYLLSSDTYTTSSTTSMAPSNSNNESTESSPSMNASSSLPRQTNNTSSPSSNRSRTMSESSIVSQNSIDYDVVPRGAIYLLGCSVEPNNELTRPGENLYAFTITPPTSNTETECHLAANTPELRVKWMQQLIRICIPPPRPTPTLNVNTTTTPPPSLPSTTPPSKWEYAPESVVFKDVPDQVITRIKTLCDTYIPLCQSNLGWTKLFDKDGVEAHTRSEGALQVVKSTTTLPQHPRQVFNLLLNPLRRLDYETNIRNTERLKWYNQHTFLDYFAYHPVWPTSARDFAVVHHWQVLEQQGVANDGDDSNSDDDTTKEFAICMIAVSCPEGDQMKPPQPDHVRGDLKIMFTMLRAKKRESDGVVCCHMTRLLSYDLCGSIPYNLTNTILLQQASLPHVIDLYLEKFESQPPERLKSGSLTTDDLVRDVANHLNLRPQKRRINLDDRSDSIESPDSPSSATGEKCNQDKELTPVSSEIPEQSEASSLILVATVLLSPVCLYHLNILPFKELWFVITSICAVGWVSKTSTSFTSSTTEPSQGPSLLLVATILLAPVCLYYTDVLPLNELWFVITSICAVGWVLSLTKPSMKEQSQSPSPFVVTTVLLSPACFYHLDILPFNELVFVITTIYSIRWVVLLHLGPPLVNARIRARLHPPMGAMICRFSVDLKGVLRFIANNKEEKLEQLKGDNLGIPITHIVVCALARAMAKKKEFWNFIHVSIPYLGIDDYYPDDSINISVAETTKASRSSSSCNTSIITIPKADEYDVQEVADYLAANKGNKAFPQQQAELMNPLSLVSSMVGLSRDSSAAFGKCILYVTPEFDHCEVDSDDTSQDSDDGPVLIDAAPVDGVTVAAVVSGIRQGGNGFGSGLPPKPTLSMSITINSPFADMDSCRRFAKDVQKLIKSPEMFDEKQ